MWIIVLYCQEDLLNTFIFHNSVMKKYCFYYITEGIQDLVVEITCLDHMDGRLALEV